MGTRTELAILTKRNGGLPWWSNGWESACHAGTRVDPGLGDSTTPHHIPATEPKALEPVLRSKKPL